MNIMLFINNLALLAEESDYAMSDSAIYGTDKSTGKRNRPGLTGAFEMDLDTHSVTSCKDTLFTSRKAYKCSNFVLALSQFSESHQCSRWLTCLKYSHLDLTVGMLCLKSLNDNLCDLVRACSD